MLNLILGTFSDYCKISEFGLQYVETFGIMLSVYCTSNIRCKVFSVIEAYDQKNMPLFYSAPIFFNCAFYESWPFKMIKYHQRQKINIGKKIGFDCLELKQAHFS